MPHERSDRPVPMAGDGASRRVLAWLIAGNLLVFLLVAGLSAWSVLASRRLFEQRALDATDNLVRGLQQAIESELERVDTVVHAIVQDHARESSRLPHDAAVFGRILGEREQLLDNVESLRMTDAAGIVRYGRGVPAGGRVDLSDRDYFIRARDAATPSLQVSEPLVGRISRQWVIALARRLERPDGSFDGIVVANIPVDHFRRMFTAVQIGPHGAVSLRTNALRLVARHTGQDPASSDIGNTKVSAELQAALLSHPQAGRFIARTALDGIERAAAYRRLEAYPLLVIAGLATEDFLAPWRRDAALVATLCLCVGLVQAGLSVFLRRAWRRTLAAGQALRASEAFLDRTGRIANVGGWELDLRQRRIAWSAQACRLLDWPSGPPPRLREVLRLIPPDARALLRSRVRDGLRGGTPWDLELPLSTARGRAIWVRAFGEAVSADGRPLRLAGALQDITEQRQRQAELEREQALRSQVERHAAELDALLRERSEMQDVLAHEVRRPLNNASAALQGAAAVLAGLDETAASARLLHARAVMAQVQARLDNTLAVASLLAGPAAIEPRDNDIDTLVALSIGDLPEADRERIRVERTTPTRTAAMDPGLMRLALRNLLANALAYGPPGSTVRLRLSDSDTPLALLIDVIDSGDGVPAELLPRLFERGSRGARHRTLAGHGLGLHIVRRVMELHGGSVVLHDNRPGEVTMRLILVQAPGG